ncbi:2-carboxy-1,4-naphthoquinone phytyltransferase [Trichothermofontia sp.]
MTTPIVPPAPVRSPQPDRRQLWLAAIKPPMYSVAVIPIMVGTAIAVWQSHPIQTHVFLICLIAAILIVAWLNLSNDVFDSETGIDVNKAHSVVNLTGNKSLVFGVANGCLAAGFLGIGTVVWQQQDGTILGLIAIACALGYSYQGPPFRLGYQGLGEWICLVTFGPLAVAAAYYSQTQAWPSEVGQWLALLVASLFVGSVTSLILFCSHFHQVEDDLAAGKRSPVARLGTQRSAQLLPWLCGLSYGLVGLAVVTQLFPGWTLLSGLSGPIAVCLCQHVGQYHDQPEQVKNCKFIAVKLHFWSGLFLSLGFTLPSLMPLLP